MARKVYAIVICLVICLTIVGIAAGDPPPVPSTIRGALINTDGAVITPGDLVRVRLDGAALAALLDPNQPWELVAAGDALAAHVVIETPPTLTPVDLNIDSASPAGQSTIDLVLDRGTQPVALNKLRVRLKGETTGIRCELAYSKDKADYQPDPTKFLLWQRVTADGVFRQDDLPCQPGVARYIRLRATDALGLEFSQVEGFYVGEWLAPPETAPVSLGPMRTNADTTEHIWPLILPDNRLPLVWISLIPPAGETIRRVELVRLANDLTVASSLAWSLWSNQLPSKAGPVSWHELSLEEAYSTTEGWALLVDDAAQKPWQLSQPQVKVAPVWLVFTAPTTWPAVLWIGQGRIHALEPGSQALDRAFDAGRLSELPLTPEADATQQSPGPIAAARPGTPWVAYGLLAGALVLALVGAGLLVLRRRDGSR